MNYETLLEAKWSKQIIGHGFTAVPNMLIEYRKELGLSVTDFYVLVAIEKYRWDSVQKPWPSLNTLAKLTSLSVRTVSRSTSNLEDAGLLIRIHRMGNSNLYDMQPLIEELDDIVDDLTKVTIPNVTNDQSAMSDMSTRFGQI